LGPYQDSRCQRQDGLVRANADAMHRGEKCWGVCRINRTKCKLARAPAHFAGMSVCVCVCVSVPKVVDIFLIYMGNSTHLSIQKSVCLESRSCEY